MKIKKDKIRVVVYTEHYRIVGNLHYIPGTRLTDTLNVKTRDFIPLTEVVVMDNKENAIFVEVPYLAVFREAILFIHPLESEDSVKQAKSEEVEPEGG